MAEKDKDKQVAIYDGIKPTMVSPWTDDSGPNIIEIIHNKENMHLLTPANLGLLLTVHFLCPFCYAHLLFDRVDW